jgi:hypothetical protein
MYEFTYLGFERILAKLVTENIFMPIDIRLNIYTVLSIRAPAAHFPCGSRLEKLRGKNRAYGYL